MLPSAEDLTDERGRVYIRWPDRRVHCQLIDTVCVEGTRYAILRSIEGPTGETVGEPIVRLYKFLGSRVTVPPATNPRHIELALAAHAASLERRSATAG